MTPRPPQVVSGSPVFVGIDVAKDKLDLGRSDAGELLVFPNDAAGVARIVELLKAASPACIVIESTSGLGGSTSSGARFFNAMEN